MSFFVGRLLVVVSIAGMWGVTAAQPQKREPLPESMRVTVNQVVLDVVVVDKKGQQIRDLSEQDFEIYEDKVLQKLNSARYVGMSRAKSPSTETKPATPASGPAPEREQTQQLNLITFIFDRISLYGRQMARQAAEKYLEELGPNDYLSVVVIDTRLQVLSEFSENRERLRQALILATSGTSRQFADASRRIQDTFNRGEILTDQVQAANQENTRPAGATSPNSSLPYSEEQANRALLNLLRSASHAENYIQGTATVDGLKQLVRSQRELPGRKALVFFAEELQLPLGVVERFRDLISAANRANISFYSIDTSGLQQEGELTRTSGELTRISGVAKRQQMKRRGAVTLDEVALSDNANEAIRLSSQENLSALATSTGGAMVANTNDLGPGLKTVSADFRSHYELSYTPSNRRYDGSYRKIEIRMKRAGLVVRARDGYYALPDNDLAESPFEIPLLDALTAPTPPSDFPFRSRSFVFPNGSAEPEILVYLDIPLAGFQFPIDSKKKEYAGRLAILLAVKNSLGKSIEKFSQEFPLSGPKEKVGETQARNFIFHRTTVLPPGRYTVEAVVHDVAGQKLAVKKSVLLVPAKPQSSLQVSSVVLVKRIEASAADSEPSENPLQLGKQLIVPSLDSAFELAKWGELGFYFRVLAGNPEPATVDLILSQEGKAIGRIGERPLPAPDQHGQISYVAGLPLESFSAGNYEAEVIVHQGNNECRSKTVFSLR